MGWQPIETAPKDRIILVCEVRDEPPIRYTDHICAAFWSAEKTIFIGGSYGYSSGWLRNWDSKMCFPTHWMPLPEPPNDKINRRGHRA